MAFPITAQKYGTLSLILLYVIDMRPGAAGRLNFTTHDTPRPWLKNYLHSTLIIHVLPVQMLGIYAIYSEGKRFASPQQNATEKQGLKHRGAAQPAMREGAREREKSKWASTWRGENNQGNTVC